MSILDRIEATNKDVKGSSPGAPAKTAERTAADQYGDLKFRLHEKLVKQMDVSKLAGRERSELQQHVEEAARTLLATEDVPLTRDERARLIDEIADEVLGLGPIEPLLKDATISEVMVNKPNEIY